MKASRMIGLVVCAVAIVSILVGSCAQSKPFRSQRFWACGDVLSVDHKAHAFAAMLLALNERGWKIMKRDHEKRKVTAYSCYTPDPRYCANLVFQANKSGQVVVTQMPGRPVPPKLRDDLERWMQGFNKTYGKYSCYTDDALRQAMEPFGFTF
jgi:hypothetical protein